MIRKIAYITIEDSTGAADLKGVAGTVLDEFPNLDMHVMEDTPDYFVLKFIYDEYEEIKEVSSTTAYILSEDVTKFTITINHDE